MKKGNFCFGKYFIFSSYNFRCGLILYQNYIILKISSFVSELYNIKNFEFCTISWMRYRRAIWSIFLSIYIVKHKSCKIRGRALHVLFGTPISQPVSNVSRGSVTCIVKEREFTLRVPKCTKWYGNTRHSRFPLFPNQRA